MKALGCLVFVLVVAACAGAVMWFLGATGEAALSVALLVLLAIFIVTPTAMLTGVWDELNR